MPRRIILSFIKDESSKGISPASLFLLKSTVSRLEQADMLSGISPVNELLWRDKIYSLRKFPIWGGISWLKLLFSSLNSLKKLRLLTCGDMEPESLRLLRSNTVTLWCRRPHLTPRHWQKWREVFHKLMTPKGSSVILAWNCSKANRSVSLLVFWMEKTATGKKVKDMT